MRLNVEAIESLTRILREFGYAQIKISDELNERVYRSEGTLGKRSLLIEAEQWEEI